MLTRISDRASVVRRVQSSTVDQGAEMNLPSIPKMPKWLLVATLLFSLPIIRRGCRWVIASLVGQETSIIVQLPLVLAWLFCLAWMILYLTFRDNA